ncbi:hypothetical protein [Oceaniglobus roseus]|uniref:hypothetical protein n=1 Tax=Oceaniglobus roseus TaxID=1737570 RepID=UPI0012FFD816|nr:hypothetical protein [Kandeliimicrobium roseum]
MGLPYGLDGIIVAALSLIAIPELRRALQPPRLWRALRLDDLRVKKDRGPV